MFVLQMSRIQKILNTKLIAEHDFQDSTTSMREWLIVALAGSAGSYKSYV